MNTIITLVIVATISTSCGIVADDSNGNSSDSGGNGGSVCVLDVSCEPYCGSLGLSDRCSKAFGVAYASVVECGAGYSLPDCCRSLSAFSPGLASDCDGASGEVICCESSGSGGSGGCPPVVDVACDCCNKADGVSCCNGHHCSQGLCQ